MACKSARRHRPRRGIGAGAGWCLGLVLGLVWGWCGPQLACAWESVLFAGSKYVTRSISCAGATPGPVSMPTDTFTVAVLNVVLSTACWTCGSYIHAASRDSSVTCPPSLGTRDDG